MPSRARPIATLGLVLLLVFAGCMGGGGAGGGADVSSGAGGASGGSGGAATGGGPAAGSAQAGNAQVLQVRQARIKTGHVQLEVENVSTTQRNLTRTTNREGGYVSASSETTRSVDGENVTTGRLVLRVPSRNFSALFSRVKAAGMVRDSRTNTTDVTGRLIDLEARLNNSRAQRERLRALYANATDTEATLAVQERLSAVQSRIERLQGQLQSLRGQIAYSTITVELTESAPEPATEQWYETGVLAAFFSSIGGVLATLRAMVVALAYLAPYLLVFGLPAVAAGYVVYRRGETRLE